jgi:hypothetical protein
MLELLAAGAHVAIGLAVEPLSAPEAGKQQSSERLRLLAAWLKLSRAANTRRAGKLTNRDKSKLGMSNLQATVWAARLALFQEWQQRALAL